MSEMKGTLSYIGKVTQQTHGDRTFNKQKFLLTVPGYNGKDDIIPFEVGSKLQDQMDQYQQGQEVTVHYNYRGNGYTNKTTGEPDAFLSLQAWRIERGAVHQPVTNYAANTTQGQGGQYFNPSPEEADKLPF